MRRLGVLTRTHGLAGGLRCAVDGETTPSVAAPCDAAIGYSESFLQPIRLARYEVIQGDPLLFFEGVTSAEKAAELVDRAVFLEESLISYENPYSDPRVIGYDVRSEQGEDLGKIDGIIRTPAHYIWSVRKGEREWLLPATEPFVLSFEDDARCVTVRLIPGLLGDEEEEGSGDSR